MTVKELIEELQRYPADMLVCREKVHNGLCEGYRQIHSIESAECVRTISPLGNERLDVPSRRRNDANLEIVVL